MSDKGIERFRARRIRSNGYTSPLSNPPGITSGDKGCGFADGDIWWNTSRYEQRSAILNLEQPLWRHVTDSELRIAGEEDRLTIPKNVLPVGVRAGAG